VKGLVGRFLLGDWKRGGLFLEMGGGRMKAMKQTTTSFLITVACLVTLTAHSDEYKAPLSIIVKSGRVFEVDARTSHMLILSNSSSKVLTVPKLSPNFLRGKEEDPVIEFYVKEHILKIEVSDGSRAVPIKTEWEVPQTNPRDFPTQDLKPGEATGVSFSLTRKWYPSFFSLTAPGTYTVTVTLDTRQVHNPSIFKGLIVSEPCCFKIVPVPVFRPRNSTKSANSYARERITFFLRRIIEGKGEYFPNVEQIINTEEGIPVLIDLTDNEDAQIATTAKQHLVKFCQHEAVDDLIASRQIGDTNAVAHIEESLRLRFPKRYPIGQPIDVTIPDSKEAWHEWWIKTGSKLSTKEIWQNFCSHWS